MQYTIYTSYWGNLKNLPIEAVVGISQGIPKNWTGPRIMELCPPWNMVKNVYGLSPLEWKERYFQQISVLDPKKVAKALNHRIILCWEKPGERCHRHYVIEWLRNAGLEVETAEWGKTPQTELF